MDRLGELRVKTLIAFTAMRLELGWRPRAVDTYDKQLLIQLNEFSDVIDLAIQGDIRY